MPIEKGSLAWDEGQRSEEWEYELYELNARIEKLEEEMKQIETWVQQYVRNESVLISDLDKS